MSWSSYQLLFLTLSVSYGCAEGAISTQNSLSVAAEDLASVTVCDEEHCPTPSEFHASLLQATAQRSAGRMPNRSPAAKMSMVEDFASPSLNTQAERLRWLKPIAWVHVPKAGTSLVSTLIHHPDICPLMPADVEFPDDQSSFKDEKGRTYKEHDFWSAHNRTLLCPGAFSDLLESPPGHVGIGDVYDAVKGHGIIMLRQPEQRIISGYNYGFHSWPRQTPPESLRQYAEATAGCTVRMLTRAGPRVCKSNETVTKEETLLAVQRLREGFPFVGILEEFDLSVCLFHAMFGGACKTADLTNTRPGPKRVSSWYDTSALRGFRDLHDRMLYEEAKRIFYRSVRAYGLDEPGACKCGSTGHSPQN